MALAPLGGPVIRALPNVILMTHVFGVATGQPNVTLTTYVLGVASHQPACFVWMECRFWDLDWALGPWPMA